MLSQVARDYLQRFSNLMTQSVYASKGLEDYSRMKRYCDYLDYDKISLFRDKGKNETGLRNIGNTCYLNVILQLLFHINYIREKILTSDIKSELINLFKTLFGEMSVGRLVFADPTDLFDFLKSTSSDIFIPGVQNDFHEIFTLLIDKMSQSYKDAAPEEARFINKILFGRMATKIDFLEGKTTKIANFNIINLEVAQGSFERAFQRWKYYKIQGYETPKGAKVSAIAENMFLETPALMAFFINRVTYKANKLQKDTRVFEFDRSILINKFQQSQKTKQIKPKSQEREKEYLQEKAVLEQWLQKIELQRTHLTEALKYLKAKEAPLLSQPHVPLSLTGQIDNPLGQAALSATAAYLEREIDMISKKMEEVRREVSSIEDRIKKLEEEGNYETYLLWAVMIHQGPSAVHGHYKVCININDRWFEYNDRIVSAIPSEKIQEYKAKGQICCLFYRRPTLFCDTQRIPISFTLKNMVSQQQKAIRCEIDKARLLQSLYQETESANILLEHEIHYGIHQRYQYFFKPVHYALAQKMPIETCKGLMIMDTISSEAFRNALAAKMLSEESVVDFPRIKFGIPEQYFAVGDILRAFLSKQALIFQVTSAYEELASKRLKFTKKNVKERYLEMLEIIVLKGLYYLKALPEGNLMDEVTFERLNTAIDKLLQNMDHSSEFVLVAIAIKSSIVPRVGFYVRERSMLKTITIDNFGDYFSENFRFWIKQREILSKLDESNFTKGAPALSIKE